MDSFFPQLLNGLVTSMLLFVLAAGLSLIFGLMDVINLAHGAFYLLGGYVGLALVRGLDQLRASSERKLIVAHFNHRLRGAESDADQSFVQELAEELGLRFVTAAAESDLAQQRGGRGLEGAAREVIGLVVAFVLEREQAVAPRFQGLAQGFGRIRDQIGKAAPFQLAALVEQLPRGEVAVDDEAARIDRNALSMSTKEEP